MQTAARTVTVPGLGIEFDILADDTIIGPAIAGGSWEAHETALFRAHLVPGCKVVDLGANVGWFAVQAVLAGAEVHAFEPVPFIADLAERNIERANARGPGRGVLHRCAAGAAPGSARIVLAKDNHGDNRVLDAGGAAPADLAGAEELEIRVERVDDLVSGPARVLKIDTQGSEWLALQGARELLAASPQLALLLEFWPYALRGCEPKALLDFLVQQGFTLGKATAAPYPISAARLLQQASHGDPVKGGFDLYAVRGLPFHVLGAKARLKSVLRSLREE
ncbi:MAG: FkbM family methyltransferase [Planctomycetes bacterium]|nr:FkbM family methyltransferase [Planctomycetota bacterium]